MAQDAGKKSPLDELGTPRGHKGLDPEQNEGLSPLNMRGIRQMPFEAATPGEAEGAGYLLQRQSEHVRKAFGQQNVPGDCCFDSMGSGEEVPACCQENGQPLEGETRPRNRDFALRESAHSADCGGKESRSGSSSSGGVPCVLSPAPERPVFCSVGLHSLTPTKPASRKRASPVQRPRQQQRQQQRPQKEQRTQQLRDAAVGDPQREGEEARNGFRCTACGTLKVRAPVGFTLMQNPSPSWGQLRMGTCAEAPQAESAASPGASVPHGTPRTNRRQVNSEGCAWTLPVGGPKGGGPYHLLRQQQQQPKQGEFVAGSLQWGQPTSFWLVESVRDEGVEREFRRLFRINSPDSRIALSSFRLLVTLMVVLAAIKYGVSTYFPPAMKIPFICFFCADVVIWVFFACEAALRARAMGLKRFFRDRQFLFDTFLQLVGLSAISLRTCILLDVGGLGTRVFDPDSLEWKTGIANDFIIGDVQIALVALDTVQLARIYRLSFSCRELFFLTRSILHSLRSLLWTALVVLVVIYTCAVFCTWAYYDEDDAEMRLLWGNLVLSMFTLFTVLTLEGWNNVATATAEKHPFSRIFFVAYICFTTLTLLNIVTGIILDAYVDMSNRLLMEANYKDDLEKDIHNEKVLLSAFEKTPFLVCMRPAVSTFSAEGSAFTAANLDHTTSGWAGGDSGHECTIPTLLREGETATTWRHALASSSMATQAAASASQSPRAPMCAAGTHFERKLTGVASEDSTARPSTESAADSEPLQIRTHLPDTVQLDGINVRTCVRYLRIGGHQPMDILRDPIIQDALQAAHIPFYQAFDVLSMFHQRGIQFVTVKEFAEACSRVVGSATGRQLLQVQLELQQKLCGLEQCIRSLSRQKQFKNNYSTTSKLDLS